MVHWCFVVAAFLSGFVAGIVFIAYATANDDGYTFDPDDDWAEGDG